MALPYDAFERGPPNVPCQQERLEYLNQIKALDATPRDPQVSCPLAHAKLDSTAGRWGSCRQRLQHFVHNLSEQARMPQLACVTLTK